MTATAAQRADHPAPSSSMRRSWWPDVLGSACAFSVLAVVALWVRNGGIQDLTGGLGAWLASAGRLTGLLSSDLMLVQVFLMARLPSLERSFGQDRLARWHRIVGFTSFNLMLAHILLITLGYAATTKTGILEQFWGLVITYPGMLLAAAATVMLVTVVVTSLRAARRRLRYESWHLLHLYAYLGVGLAIPHQLWTGTDFVSSTPATIYWWTAYGVAAGSVVIFRLAAPIGRSLFHQLRVLSVVAEAPGIHSVYLTGRRLDLLRSQAGQFFHWRFLAGPGWTRAHPYSLSAAPRPGLLRITVKELGEGSRLIKRLQAGTRALIEGPYGIVTGAARRTPRMTMLACGIGITPLRALLEEQTYRPGEAILLYRARTAADLALRGELDAIAYRRGVRVHYLIGPRGEHGSWLPRGHGTGEHSLLRMVPDIATHDVFICGPDDWMKAAVSSARRAGVPDEQIHLEHFSW